MSPLARRLLPLGVAAVALTGCGDASADTLLTLPAGAPELACASLDAESGIWETAPFPATEAPADCPWIAYPGRATIELSHELGRTPRAVEFWLSFDEHGVPSAPSAGDLSRLEIVTGDVVRFRNATNEDFFVRVALR